jgi:hypothetical protein
LAAGSNSPSAASQRAGTGRFQIVDHDLVFGRARIGGELAAGHHFHALLGPEFQPRHGALPDHRFQPGAVVLQREIGVAGGVRAAIAGNLAAHPHIAEHVLDRALQRAGNLADGEFGSVAA